MVKLNKNLMRVLEYREKKSQELKRPISLSEAVALWLSESIPHPVVNRREGTKTSSLEVNIYS